MEHSLKHIVPLMMAAVLFSSNGLAADKSVASDGARPLTMGFSDAFDKKFYEKKNFGIALLGASVVVAGAASYFTAGAGAPVAATGVSTVASWVGGGGAGSYMAGLSTIGSAFGGNAMVGAAILNGVSIATIGGGPVIASMSAAQKGLAMFSISATMLDGVAVFNGKDTEALHYRVALPIPDDIGSKELRQQAEKLRKLGVEERKLGEKMDDIFEDRLKAQKAGKDSTNAAKKLADAESKLRETKARRVQLEKDIETRARSALKQNVSAEDRVLLAVLAKNLGKTSLFADLIERVQTEGANDAGYVYYLRAVAKIEKNQIKESLRLLEDSSRRNPYAIEPTILEVNILGREFAQRKERILNIVSSIEKSFDSDKYSTPFSLVSLHYRVGTLSLIHKDYSLAEMQFNAALKKRSLWEKYGLRNEFDSMIKVGLANALYGQNRKDEAMTIVAKLLKNAKEGQARDVVCAQFMGRCV